MYKTVNIILFSIVLLFFWNVYTYYASNINIKIKEFNRNNINQIIKEKTSNIPILKNDTNNVIEFNDGFSNEIKNNKSRSFWNLLTSE